MSNQHNAQESIQYMKESAIQKGNPTWFNEQNNEIFHSFLGLACEQADRVATMFFDPSFGWKTLPTPDDCSFFRIWYHPTENVLATFCEGDMALAVCKDKEALDQEIQAVKNFYL